MVSWFLWTGDGDWSRRFVVWCGASRAVAWAVVVLSVEVVKLVGVGCCRWMVGRAKSDSRIPDEVDEEEACSELLSGFLRIA